jgi:hypothetical protein
MVLTPTNQSETIWFRIDYNTFCSHVKERAINFDDGGPLDDVRVLSEEMGRLGWWGASNKWNKRLMGL